MLRARCCATGAVLVGVVQFSDKVVVVPTSWWRRRRRKLWFICSCSPTTRFSPSLSCWLMQVALCSLRCRQACRQVRLYCLLVVLASLVAPSWTSMRTYLTVFRLLRGILLVMGATTTLQLSDIMIRVLIVILVVLIHLLRRDGPPENISHCFQGSTWHTARHESRCGVPFLRYGFVL